MNRKDEYLSELHALLRAVIGMHHQKYNGEPRFVNSFIISGRGQEYKSADRSTADAAIHSYETLNECIPADIDLEFCDIFFDENLELSYVFNLLVDIEDSFEEIEMLFKKSQDKVLINQAFEATFDNLVTEDDLSSMIGVVKEQATFGLIKRS